MGIEFLHLQLPIESPPPLVEKGKKPMTSWRDMQGPSSVLLPDYQTTRVDGLSRVLLASAMRIYWRHVLSTTNELLLDTDKLAEGMNMPQRGISNLKTGMSAMMEGLNGCLYPTGWKFTNNLDRKERTIKQVYGKYYFSHQEPIINELHIRGITGVRRLVEEGSRIKNEKLKTQVLTFIKDNVLGFPNDEIKQEEVVGILASFMKEDKSDFGQWLEDNCLSDLKVGKYIEGRRVFSRTELVSLYGLLSIYQDKKIKAKGNIDFSLDLLLEETKKAFGKANIFSKAFDKEEVINLDQLDQELQIQLTKITVSEVLRLKKVLERIRNREKGVSFINPQDTVSVIKLKMIDPDFPVALISGTQQYCELLGRIKYYENHIVKSISGETYLDLYNDLILLVEAFQKHGDQNLVSVLERARKLLNDTITAANKDSIKQTKDEASAWDKRS